MGRKGTLLPAETLLSLRAKLASLPLRSPQRQEEVTRIAKLFDVSSVTVYRALKALNQPKGLSRSDRGHTRKIDEADKLRYCEIIAALKIRTSNKQGRHISTGRAIEILEKFGVETPTGHIKTEKGLLTKSTVNRWMSELGYDHARMVRAPAAVRFEAKQSNELWQFDISYSDLKHIKQPEWINPDKGQPTLLLFSVVDDRSGVAYQEYHCVYGEDAETALLFLYNAMAPKEDTPFQGIPKMIYMDNGPVAKSLVFQNMMERLGVDWKTHLPAGSDGRRTTARSKGKVERPFRTVKEAHETLYHFHKPETEAEANLWLVNYIKRYNEKDHRREPHSRIEDWLSNLPKTGIREMCSWQRYCVFAREPEHRKVGIDAHITIRGTSYEVDPGLSGEEVTLWWGLFDHELYVEWEEKHYGPYRPSGGPIPLHRYRKHARSARDKRANTVASLAENITIPRAALSGLQLETLPAEIIQFPKITFQDPDPWGEITFSNTLSARRGIADQLGKPLAELSPEDLTFITDLLENTLDKKTIKDLVYKRFIRRAKGD